MLWWTHEYICGERHKYWSDIKDSREFTFSLSVYGQLPMAHIYILYITIYIYVCCPHTPIDGHKILLKQLVNTENWKLKCDIICSIYSISTAVIYYNSQHTYLLNHELCQGLLYTYRNRVVYIYLLTTEETHQIVVNYHYCLEFVLR